MYNTEHLPNVQCESKESITYYTDYYPIDDSRDQRFSGYRIAATNKAKAIIAEAVHLLLGYESYRVPRKRKRKAEDFQTFRNQVEAVICELIHRELTHPDGWTAIPLSNAALGSRDRYKPPTITKAIRDVLVLMRAPEMEYAEYRSGLWVPSNRSLSTVSTIRAGERLRSRIKEHGLTCADIELNRAQETIVLKAVKAGHNDNGALLQYDDTEQTRAYRRDMEFINGSLASADICYLGHHNGSQTVDINDRHLRRCFNNGSFCLGGRLFGGFWMSMSKANRRAIQIQGSQTLTLDFGQMNPRMLYGLAKQDYKGEDAYMIPGLEDHRDGVKAIFNSMLHRTTPMVKKPKGIAELFPSHLKIKHITSSIWLHHKPIADLFYKGIGMRLFYEESEILVEVLKRLFSLNIVALPIHDAVIVAEHYHDQAVAVMKAVFKERIGIDALVRIEA